MPVYKVEEEGRPTRVVQAVSSAAAIQHVVRGRFTTTNLKKADDLADVIASGVTIEKASDAPEPEPQTEPEHFARTLQQVDGDEPPAGIPEPAGDDADQ